MSEVTVKNFDELIEALSKNVVPVKETITRWEYTQIPVVMSIHEGARLPDRLNEAGRAGWEAICLLPGGTILFKKPLV